MLSNLDALINKIIVRYKYIASDSDELFHFSQLFSTPLKKFLSLKNFKSFIL